MFALLELISSMGNANMNNNAQEEKCGCKMLEIVNVLKELYGMEIIVFRMHVETAELMIRNFSLVFALTIKFG